METEYFNAPHRKKFRLKKHIMLITFLIFLGILSFLIYTSFYDVSFFDKLREVRHGTKYYGKKVEKDYAKNVLNFVKEIYPKLKRKVLD